MNKSNEVIILAEEILNDLTKASTHLHFIMLKTAKLALLTDLLNNYKWFIDNVESAERSETSKHMLTLRMKSAKDPFISISSANPTENIGLSLTGKNNKTERDKIVQEYINVSNWIASLRKEVFRFTLEIYNKWKFGSTAENIFERKRAKIEPVFLKILPDIQQRLNSINQNLISTNSEDWKNAVVSCRTLFMDIADEINPPKSPEDKGKYINRIKDFISPKLKLESTTKATLLEHMFEELKKRIELTADFSQGSSHSDRPSLDKANNIVLYTYLALAEIAEIYIVKKEFTEIAIPAFN